MKVVYMGTPDFAVGPLQAMLSGGVEVLAVVTQPDRPNTEPLNTESAC